MIVFLCSCGCESSMSRSTAYAAFQAASDPGTVLLQVDHVPVQADSVPRVVRSLLGLEVTHVACGGQHVAVVTRSGTVLTW